MRILQFGKFFPPHIGGMESFIFDLTEELSRKVKCDVLCSNSKNKTTLENKKSYCIIRTASFGEIFSTSISPAMIWWLKKIGNKYDIIHLHFPDPMANLAYFLARPKTKLILHWHSDIIRPKKLLPFYEPLQNWLLKRAEKIIATSPNYLENSKYLKKYKTKCVPIPLGLNSKKLKINKNLVQKIKNLYNDKPIIFTLGRLIYYKGFEYLIEALKDINGYLLIGGSGPLRKKLEEQIEELNLKKKVILLGKIKKEELGSYYQACDLFCLPSIYKSEAFGLVQLEAMYFGKPIVSTNIPGSGVKWVNQNNITGLVVPPKDNKALAEAINKILKNPELKKKFGENAQRRFEKEFKIEAVANKIFKLYNEIIYEK